MSLLLEEIMTSTFENLLVLGRPAGGKSEFIDYLHNTPDDQRAKRYHIGIFEILDDFIWIWEKFEEDDLWEKTSKGRIFSQKCGENYGLVDGTLFTFMMERFNVEVPKKYRKEQTLLIEFSRGGENGYREALNLLSPEVLKKAAILYIQVSFEESWRRNVARYEEKLKHSILAHMVPRETMEKFYKVDDWKELTGEKETGYIECHGIKVPFVTMLNEPESTDPEVLDLRYGSALKRLMQLKKP